MRKKDRIAKLKKERRTGRKRYSPNKHLNYMLELHHARASHTPVDNKGRKKAHDQLAKLRIKYPVLFK